MSEAPTLKKALSQRQLTMIAIGGVIGAGLFVGSGVVIGDTGPGVFITYGMAGVLIIMVMRMLAEMAVANPSTGSFADYARTNFPHAKVQEFPTWNEVLVALHKGEIVSAYRDEFEVKRVLKADPTVSLVLRTVTLKDLEDTLGIGVAVTDSTLLAYVNQFLAQRTEKLDIHKVLQALDR